MLNALFGNIKLLIRRMSKQTVKVRKLLMEKGDQTFKSFLLGDAL